jgi:PAS domain S-box-containing protein
MSDGLDRAYRLFRNVKETNQLPWWEWHVPTNTVTGSPLKASMLGYDPADFDGVGHQAYTDLLHRDDYEPTMQAMRDHLEGRAPLFQIDYRIRRASGEYTWYCDRGATIERADDGSPLLLRGVVLDLGPELRAKSHVDTVVAAIRNVLRHAGSDAPVVICSHCTRMRYGDDRWTQVGTDLEKGFLLEVSHGICEDCLRTLYPDEAEAIIAQL